MKNQQQIVDNFGRVHTNLRISVTDRCNIRCFYCMPDENIQFLPQKQVLTFEEIYRFAKVAAELGVNKIRVTGGEPLVRRELPKLIEMLVAIDGIDDVALTTNGVLLSQHVEALKQSGLHR
ncbi:MAG: radical SAM protein, partial [Planctomycetota bacterium]